MKKTEIAFLVAVSVFAATFSTAAIYRAARGMRWGERPPETFAPSAGTPRDVDMEKLQRRLREHFLSGREALYYEKVDDAGEAADAGGNVPK